MFRNLLKPDSGLMITMNWITDCIFLSLFWLLGCVPVVTVATSFAALYDSVFKSFRAGEKHPWQRFWQVYRANWKAGILPSFAVLGVFAVVLTGMILFWNAAVAQQISFMLFAGMAFLAVLVLGILSLVCPILSRFENGFLGILRNSFLLGLANLPRTLLLGILNALTFFFCAKYVFPLFFLPGLSALLGSVLIERMFKPYMTHEEAAE